MTRRKYVILDEDSDSSEDELDENDEAGKPASVQIGRSPQLSPPEEIPPIAQSDRKITLGKRKREGDDSTLSPELLLTDLLYEFSEVDDLPARRMTKSFVQKRLPLLKRPRLEDGHQVAVLDILLHCIDQNEEVRKMGRAMRDLSVQKSQES